MTDDEDVVYYRGGPRDGRVLPGTRDPNVLLMFDLMGEVEKGASRFAYYKITEETHTVDHGSIPIAEYIGDTPAGQQT